MENHPGSSAFGHERYFKERKIRTAVRTLSGYERLFDMVSFPSQRLTTEASLIWEKPEPAVFLFLVRRCELRHIVRHGLQVAIPVGFDRLNHVGV